MNRVISKNISKVVVSVLILTMLHVKTEKMFLSDTNMDETVNDDGSCSNISEKIRRLRTNFFDQELKLLEQSLETINQHETSKWIHSSETNRNLDPEHYVDQTPSTNCDTYSHLPKLTDDQSNVYSAQNVIQNVLPFTANRDYVVDKEHCKIIAENSRSHSFHKSGVCGTKEFVEENSVFRPGGFILWVLSFPSAFL